MSDTRPERASHILKTSTVAKSGRVRFLTEFLPSIPTELPSALSVAATIIRYLIWREWTTLADSGAGAEGRRCGDLGDVSPGHVIEKT